MTISRRDTIKLGAATVAASGLPLTASAPVATAAEPHAEPTPTATASPEFYELTVHVELDFEQYGAEHIRTWGQYTVCAGRQDGAWRMAVRRVLAADAGPSGEDIETDWLYNVAGQTEGPDALARLQALLGGQAVLDTTRVVRGLREREVAALRLASPELRADLIGLMQRNGIAREDDFARWFGRWALTASGRELDGSRFSQAYEALKARVRAERLPAKVTAEHAEEMAQRARILARLAADDLAA